MAQDPRMIETYGTVKMLPGRSLLRTLCFGDYVNADNEDNATTPCCTERALDIFFEHFFVFLLYAPPFTTSRLKPTLVRIKICRPSRRHDIHPPMQCILRNVSKDKSFILITRVMLIPAVLDEL
ncbi:hypothetical protein PUN28_001987 [Cardiocondyla obscurior]|uniref:Uncharacterized protein n=1 Tax=Cardiocondyla obscurior TaxID=286306 RepID=A0AAW2GS82_9HYME